MTPLENPKKTEEKDTSLLSELAGQVVSGQNPVAVYILAAKAIAVLAVCIIAYIGLVRFGFLPNIFAAKPVIIADTPVLVKEMKGISELFSVSQYDEIVVDSLINEKTSVDQTLAFFGQDTYTERSIVYIARGKIFAGFDLSKMDESSIVVNDSTLTIKLEAPKIIDIVANPDDFSLFKQTGDWAFNEVTAVKAGAKKQFEQRALENGILERSKNVGIQSLKAFYQALGFKYVEVEILEKG